MTKRTKRFAEKTLDILALAKDPQEYFQKMSDLIEEHDREILESVREELLKE